MAVRLDLGQGSQSDAAGDTYDSIENLTGGRFDDVLIGDSGGNVLSGGAGDDVLTGGAGDDMFVFRTGDGNDRITDFAAGAGAGDVVFFDGGPAAANGFSPLQTAAFQSGADTIIEFGGVTITLVGVAPTDLHQDDFMF